ncbi:Holliday junction branch migration protein RuvA [Canibacter sp. lx-72]|uniref:Holliday junction branch migration protein RuvA n=1 Tax=Canibacter zhuwentaonis TaxID=2837491 RepID=UPI001BDD56E6|nr:Holliday junction branch migration protein RuvA [Canibacter zhuwentaonis]MBT1017890.1 Holliday junction branch migration protein RuvA [Canibacter zhuwentaonis]
MISALTGNVLVRELDFVVLNVHGVGYRVEAPGNVLAACEKGQTVSLQTQLVVREDSLTLFGFLDSTSLQIFNLLLSVSGIGPRIALGVLNAMSAAQIIAAISGDDYKPFTAVSGIGPKGAKQIVLSLASKIRQLPNTAALAAAANSPKSANSALSAQVVTALTGLGWDETTALSAVTAASAASVEHNSQSLLRAALQILQQK